MRLSFRSVWLCAYAKINTRFAGCTGTVMECPYLVNELNIQFNSMRRENEKC